MHPLLSEVVTVEDSHTYNNPTVQDSINIEKSSFGITEKVTTMTHTTTEISNQLLLVTSSLKLTTIILSPDYATSSSFTTESQERPTSKMTSLNIGVNNGNSQNATYTTVIQETLAYEANSETSNNTNIVTWTPYNTNIVTNEYDSQILWTFGEITNLVTTHTVYTTVNTVNEVNIFITTSLASDNTRYQVTTGMPMQLTTLVTETKSTYNFVEITFQSYIPLTEKEEGGGTIIYRFDKTTHATPTLKISITSETLSPYTDKPVRHSEPVKQWFMSRFDTQVTTRLFSLTSASTLPMFLLWSSTIHKPKDYPTKIREDFQTKINAGPSNSFADQSQINDVFTKITTSTVNTISNRLTTSRLISENDRVEVVTKNMMNVEHVRTYFKQNTYNLYDTNKQERIPFDKDKTDNRIYEIWTVSISKQGKIDKNVLATSKTQTNSVFTNNTIFNKVETSAYRYLFHVDSIKKDSYNTNEDGRQLISDAKATAGAILEIITIQPFTKASTYFRTYAANRFSTRETEISLLNFGYDHVNPKVISKFQENDKLDQLQISQNVSKAPIDPAESRDNEKHSGFIQNRGMPYTMSVTDFASELTSIEYIENLSLTTNFQHQYKEVNSNFSGNSIIFINSNKSLLADGDRWNIFNGIKDSSNLNLAGKLWFKTDFHFTHIFIYYVTC